MRHRLRRAVGVLIAGALAGVVAAPAQADVQLWGTMSCRAVIGMSYVHACVDVRNRINVFTAPGKVEQARALHLVRVEAYCGEDPYKSDGLKTYWAQEDIPGGGTGAASVQGPYGGYGCNDAAFFWDLKRTSGVPVSYQTLVVTRILDQPKSEQGLAACLGELYLACSLGENIDNTGENKAWRVATVTSRPLDVRIINGLAQPLIRDDGPYWTKALRAAKGDNAAVIAAATGTGPGVGNSGALRSIFRTSGYAAVYRVGMGTDAANSPYAGASIPISILVKADGTKSGSCEPLSRPTAPFTCTIEWSGIATGVLTATVRIRAN